MKIQNVLENIKNLVGTEFDTEEEALSAREEGEKLFHQPILEKYEGELE